MESDPSDESKSHFIEVAREVIEDERSLLERIGRLGVSHSPNAKHRKTTPLPLRPRNLLKTITIRKK